MQPLVWRHRKQELEVEKPCPHLYLTEPVAFRLLLHLDADKLTSVCPVNSSPLLHLTPIPFAVELAIAWRIDFTHQRNPSWLSSP
jgi:hypothetical protein